ncbi:hypothetical protein AB0A74_18735 [Saccharothrix sp. NPDC042600]|uniref:hypothetical protein n=1 Tax=Saccharothrix TaxID=2071 RepID=UPI0033C8D036|nr:hypothetical protein GCM10017745_26530 [Saccharothrix mutabilis subsp. capreolus]
MKWYADAPVRRARQAVADLIALAWVWFWVEVALGARDAVLTLRAPGDGLTKAGNGLRDTFTDAAAKARDVPLVGGKLGEALDKGRDAGGTLVDAGNTQVEAVETTALWLAVALIAIPVAFLLITWLPLRLRYAKKAGAAQRLRDTGQVDLLALQALTTLSPRELAKFPTDPADAWRRGDPEVVTALATRYLRTRGVRGR